MAIRDIEKERAIFAYEKVEEAINNKDIKQSEYKSYCKKIPSLIQTNGLSATFAFMFSKNSPTYSLIYEQTEKWLKKRYNYQDQKELIKRFLDLDSQEYKKVTIEVLALFNWLRRFAEGKIKKDD